MNAFARPNNPDFISLYNGNIGAMSVNNQALAKGTTNNASPLLYNYRYDQLNRLVHMKAYNGFNNSSNEWTPTPIEDYKENIGYDPNGNIMSYVRKGKPGQLQMDSMHYRYIDATNQLDHVDDVINAGNYTEDIDDQDTLNYDYDAIGNLVKDKKEGISNIAWNVYGKIKSITKATGMINYSYDAAGNRISKEYNSKTTVYVRDATGNVMSVYEKQASTNLEQIELHLYGSIRLGIQNKQVVATEIRSMTINSATTSGQFTTFTRANKFFELSNHLGNILVMINDRKLSHSNNSTKFW